MVQVNSLLPLAVSEKLSQNVFSLWVMITIASLRGTYTVLWFYWGQNSLKIWWDLKLWDTYYPSYIPIGFIFCQIVQLTVQALFVREWGPMHRIISFQEKKYVSITISCQFKCLKYCVQNFRGLCSTDHQLFSNERRSFIKGLALLGFFPLCNNIFPISEYRLFFTRGIGSNVICNIAIYAYDITLQYCEQASDL